jgi:heme exporter protein A
MTGLGEAREMVPATARGVTTGCLLEVEALEIERGGYPLIEATSFSLHVGKALSLVADNGVGKTSLLRTIAGLAPVARGEFKLSCARAEVRFLGHQLGLKSSLSLLENLRFWLALEGTQVNPAAFEYALARFSLCGHEEQATQALSAGQRKRVALLRLALSPGKLWLLDEPFANLDAAGLSLVHELIEEHKSRGGAVLLSAHGALPVAMEADVVKLERAQ